MIAYNKQYIFNSALLQKAKYWLAKKLLSAEQFGKISERYKTNFYSPSLFIKIGLFIFTCVLISAALGMYTMFFLTIQMDMGEGFAAFTSFLFSIGCFIALESFIRKRNIFRSGIDEGLLYSGIGFTYGFLTFLFSDMYTKELDRFLFYSLLSLPIFGAAVARYADRLTALLLGLCIYSSFFLLILKTGDIAKMIMPFALMILSVIIYLLARRYRSKEHLMYWKHCITVFECVALLMFYVAGNYYVIRESSIEFFDMQLAPGEDIPLAWLFYLLTALVPIAYVYYGLKQKDKTLLWIGLVLVGAAAMTFKYYFSLGHPEITLTLAGTVMIIVAYVSIKYLKTPKQGITYEEETDEDSFLKTNAEALVIAQSFSQQAQPPNDPNMGGGGFGGGGAGSKF